MQAHKNINPPLDFARVLLSRNWSGNILCAEAPLILSYHCHDDSQGYSFPINLWPVETFFIFIFFFLFTKINLFNISALHLHLRVFHFYNNAESQWTEFKK